MNNDFPDRPQVREESKELDHAPKKTKWPIVSFLLSLVGEGIATLLMYVIVIAIVIATYPLCQAWQDRKEDKTRETMIEWINKIDQQAQKDIATLNINLDLDPYPLPEKDAWGNDITVTCTTDKVSYSIALRSPGKVDRIFDDIYERLTRNTKTNEVTRSQSEWTDIINNVEVITEEKTEQEIKEPIEEPQPPTVEDQPKEVPQPDTEDSPGILSEAKEKAEKATSVVKNKAQDAKRGIKKFIDKKTSNDSSKEE